MNSATIVQKLWNHCNVLRDDGMRCTHQTAAAVYLTLPSATRNSSSLAS